MIWTTEIYFVLKINTCHHSYYYYVFVLTVVFWEVLKYRFLFDHRCIAMLSLVSIPGNIKCCKLRDRTSKAGDLYNLATYANRGPRYVDVLLD